MNLENKFVKYVRSIFNRHKFLFPLLLVLLIVIVSFAANFAIINRYDAPPGADYGNYLTQVNILRGDDLRGYGLRHQPFFFIFLDFLDQLLSELNSIVPFYPVDQISFLSLKVAAASVFSIIAVPFFLLTKKLSGNNLAAAISTGLFAFFITNGEMITWGGNPNFLGFSFLLLAFYFIIDIFEKPSKMSLILSGFFLSLVIGTHILVAIFTFACLFLFAVLHVAFVGKRKERIKKNFKNIFYLILTAAVFSLPYLSFYLTFFKNSSRELAGLRFFDFLSSQLPGGLPLYDIWNTICIFIVLIDIGIAGTFWLTKYRKENKNAGLLLFGLFMTIILLAMTTAQPLRWLYFLPIPFLLCFSIFLGQALADVKQVKKTTILLMTSLFLLTIILQSTYLGITREKGAADFYQFIDQDEILALNWIKNFTTSNANFTTSGSARNVGGGGNSYAWWVEGYANRICMFTGDPDYYSFQFERDEIRATNRFFLGTYTVDFGDISVTEGYPSSADSPMISALIDGKYEKMLKINDYQNQIYISPKGNDQIMEVTPFYSEKGTINNQITDSFVNMTVIYEQTQLKLTRSVCIKNDSKSSVDVYYQISPQNLTIRNFKIILWGLIETSVGNCTIDDDSTITLYNSLPVTLTQGISKDHVKATINLLETNGNLTGAKVLFSNPKSSVPVVDYQFEPFQNDLNVHLRITTDIIKNDNQENSSDNSITPIFWNSYDTLKALKVDYVLVTKYRMDQYQRFSFDPNYESVYEKGSIAIFKLQK